MVREITIGARTGAALLAACIGAVFVAAYFIDAANATFPGKNGRIAVAGSNGHGHNGPDIFMLRPDGTDPRQVTNGPGYHLFPALSPDGRRIVFAHGYYGAHEAPTFNIFTIRVDGTGERQLTHNGYTNVAPSFSPDGERIIFTSDQTRTGSDRIFTMRADGSDRRQLDHQDNESDPVYSPNGKRIAFVRGGGLHTMRTDGSHRRFLTRHADELSYSPNGRWIAYAGCCRTEVFRIRSNGTDKQQLTEGIPAPGSSGYDNPAYSPSGSRILFTGAGDLFMMRANGSHQHPLAASDVSPSPFGSTAWQAR